MLAWRTKLARTLVLDAGSAVIEFRAVRVPSKPLEGELTVVRPATLDDADLLVGWHADPGVAEFWDGETFTRGEMLARLARTDVDAYVVESAGEPVGYLQAWFGDATLLLRRPRQRRRRQRPRRQ